MVLSIVLLVLWLIVAIVGFAIMSVLWIGVIGVVLFVATAAIVPCDGGRCGGDTL
ncbi:hypothetical protein [Nakamurella leprariae]|uniref:Uncharacterized protein n=1 Tax=Nakamurella leprariae TaxID=2803911 RepID=A0A939BW17_9ACTN|nr:hypothetical protein [Nakamurella leprariae]MBM9467093.1 hypothetical protein [Nakamurella leprariae]